jgi:hypothetical protein
MDLLADISVPELVQHSDQSREVLNQVKTPTTRILGCPRKDLEANVSQENERLRHQSTQMQRRLEVQENELRAVITALTNQNARSRVKTEKMPAPPKFTGTRADL